MHFSIYDYNTIDCRSKMISVKSERFDGVYILSFDEKSPFVNTSGFFLSDETLTTLIVSDTSTHTCNYLIITIVLSYGA